MSRKIRTLSQLQDALDNEFAWRLKEVADTKALIRIDRGYRTTAIRAGIPLLYAHWEGFVKNSARYYLSFIQFEGIPTRSLNDGLVTTAAFRILNESSNSSRTSVRINVTKFFLEELDNDCSLHEGAVSTRSNLNSKVFVDIAMGIGIDPSPYETKFNWIDTELLKSRNEIAHGKWLNFDERSFSDFANVLLGLVRQFKNDLLNAAVLGLYKRP